MRHSYAILISLLTISCAGLPYTYSDKICDFPESNPYPGGLINHTLVAETNISEKDINVEGLKFHSCKENNEIRNILVPIPLSKKEGDEINILSEGKIVYSVNLLNKFYRESRITIQNQNLVTPPKSMQERISKEYFRGQAAINTFTTFQSLKKNMSLPVDGIISSEFGVRRFINGLPRNRHIGLDIAAPEGTAVYSPSKGKVILTGDFFYKGNVIYLDHGNGLISSFSHLNSISVEQDQIIQTGEVLGYVGSTGRVTGPHLHWEVSLMGVPINPEIFLKTNQSM